MKKLPLNKLFIAMAGAGICSLQAMPQSADTEIYKTAANDRNVILRAQSPQIEDGNKANFIIDLTHMNFFQLMGVANSDTTIVVFNGDPKTPDKACPHFDLSARKYTVQQLHATDPRYKVSAYVSPADINLIEKAGCIRFPTISRSVIRPFKPD